MAARRTKENGEWDFHSHPPIRVGSAFVEA
jgi:hypothetical protein